MNLSDATNALVRRFNRYSPVNISFPDPLTCLANRHGSDKGTSREDGHDYTRIYSKVLAPLRDRPIVFVEIGLLRVDTDFRRSGNGSEGASSLKATNAPSMRMWREYFPRAKLFGFDIDDFTGVRIDGCRIFQGDMSSRADLEELLRTIGSPIDVILDDASHVSHHQQIALPILFRQLAPGGLYIIEDLHWQDPALEKAGAEKTRDMLHRFLVTGALTSEWIAEPDQRYLESAIASVEIFDSRMGSDAVAVIRKR